MKICAHLQCEEASRTRGLCATHYKRLMRDTRPELIRQPLKVPDSLQRSCQEGTNRTCVDCGERPYGGGMRCLTCFQNRVEDRRASEPQHDCGRHRQSRTCYRTCKCRCRGCQAFSAEAKRVVRARARAA